MQACRRTTRGRTIASEGGVGHVVLIAGIILIGLLAAWYICFTQYNRRKGKKALHWVEVACLGKGKIIDSYWLGANRFKAHLRFSGQWAEDASITVRLRPRPVPFQWALSLWRGQKETLTFEGDLGCAPGFNLEVLRHRWFTHNRPSEETGAKNWTISHPGPVILTTRTQWNQELTPVINTLMTARGHSLISVRFRSKSPHLVATVALETLSDQQASAGFLDIVRDLAAGASTRQ
jgi:hypothetical protein